MTTPTAIAKVPDATDKSKVTITHDKVEIKTGKWDILRISLWVVAGIILAITIWGVIDSTKKQSSIMTAFAVIIALAGIVYGFLMVFGPIFASSRLLKWAYAVGLMLLGAQVIIFITVVIWYALSDKTKNDNAVTGSTVAWNTILLVCYIAAPFLIRCYLRRIDPVLHLKSVFEVIRKPLSGVTHPPPGTTVITTTEVVKTA